MRQGPEYGQWVDRHEDSSPSLRLPLELVDSDDWRDAKTVRWVDNGDGSYTLFPSYEV